MYIYLLLRQCFLLSFVLDDNNEVFLLVKTSAMHCVWNKAFRPFTFVRVFFLHLLGGVKKGTAERVYDHLSYPDVRPQFGCQCGLVDAEWFDAELLDGLLPQL